MAITKKRNGTRKGRPDAGGKSDAVGQYASDAWSLAKRTAVGLNEIRKLINIEYKFIDVNSTSTGYNTTATIAPLSQIAQGLTSITRVGDSFRLQTIEVRGRVFAAAAATNSVVRIIIFRDLDNDGVLPPATELMEIDSVNSAPLSPFKFNRKGRFSILYDQMMTTQSILATGVSSKEFVYKANLSGHVQFLGTTAASASNGKGSVYIYIVSDESANTPTVAYYSRITFTDD